MDGTNKPNNTNQKQNAMSEQKESEIGMIKTALSKVKTIEGAWLIYEASVLPDDASETQRRESRKVFYAACDWVLKRLIVASDDEEEAECMLVSFEREINAFVGEEAARMVNQIGGTPMRPSGKPA